MIKNKLFYIFFCTVIFGQTAFCSTPNQLTTERNALSGFLDYSRTWNSEEFENILKQHPKFICSSPGHFVENLRNDLTVGDLAAHLLNLNALKILFEHGETLARPIKNNAFVYIGNVGSTGFFELCKNHAKANDDFDLYFQTLKEFARRTPSVVTMPRADGMTPCMIIAAMNDNHKRISLMLQDLKCINPQAFIGRTSTGETILHMLIKKKQTKTINDLLQLVLNDNNFQEFLTLPDIDSALKACTWPQQKSFREILQTHLNNKRIFHDTCACCAQGCLCCTNILATKHHDYWSNFYQENPDHYNAASWREQIQKIQSVW